MTVEFDRDAVSVSAKSQWVDSESFGALSAYIGTTSVSSCPSMPPRGTTSGTEALRDALADFQEKMVWIAAEFSDACAVLGSGVEATISDFDATEKTSSEAFARLRARLDGSMS
ncbi:hypothetical protein [Schaalia suimastitidis]|uniref:hypothetical protein n=1 Tax=Schaalia suimastitidis TaxID=121163 RepID=UPI0004163865|nr:hypothetical protein [Schaalia suimastitidis]